MALNAAGLNVAGANNPRWKGGLIAKTCEVCSAAYSVKPTHASSRFCSLSCVGRARKGVARVDPAKLKRTEKACEVCNAPYSIPAAHASRHHCCSKACSFTRRSGMSKGDLNPSWSGGVSRLPYPWNFREISRSIIARDSAICQSPSCAGKDKRLTTHHIDYNKQNCAQSNLICLCSACNSKANFNRPAWQELYQNIVATKKDGGGWKVEEF